MLGYPTNKTEIDNRAGYLVLTLRETLDAIARVKDFLDGKSTADLVALGYTDAEAAVLKSAFGDLANLNKVAHGQATQAQANDFFFWAKQLAGLL